MRANLFLLTALGTVKTRSTPLARHDCQTVDEVLQMFDVSPEVEGFCRSFLPIQPVYVQSTTILTNMLKASNVPVVPTVTAHVTSLTVRTTTIWTQKIVSARSTVSLDNSCTSIHPFLQSFSPSQVSLGCECLSLPTPTSTITKTRTTYSTESLLPTATVTSTQTTWTTRYTYVTRTTTSTTNLATETLGPKYCIANVAQNFGGFAICETIDLRCTHYAFRDAGTLAPINDESFFYARDFVSFNLVNGQFHAASSEHNPMAQYGILYMPDRIKGGTITYKDKAQAEKSDYALQCEYNYNTYATSCYNAQGEKLTWWTNGSDLGLGLNVPQGKRRVKIRIW